MRAARDGQLATTGLYGRVRHHQYVGFLAIMVGFLLQWTTLPTHVMFPVLVVEEKAVAAEFRTAWEDYSKRTPRFLPKLGSPPEADRRGRPDDAHLAGR